MVKTMVSCRFSRENQSIDNGYCYGNDLYNLREKNLNVSQHPKYDFIRVCNGGMFHHLQGGAPVS